MGGGVIIQRRAVLVPAANDVSIYGTLSEDDKDTVDSITAKAPGDTTTDDLMALATIITKAVST